MFVRLLLKHTLWHNHRAQGVDGRNLLKIQRSKPQNAGERQCGFGGGGDVSRHPGRDTCRPFPSGLPNISHTKSLSCYLAVSYYNVPSLKGYVLVVAQTFCTAKEIRGVWITCINNKIISCHSLWRSTLIDCRLLHNDATYHATCNLCIYIADVWIKQKEAILAPYVGI